MVQIGLKTAVALFALFLFLLHGIAEMSEEIKTNLITTHTYGTESRR